MARRAATMAIGVALCLIALAPRARAADPLPSTPMTDEKPAIVSALEKATDGLLMPSETDAPFEIVFFAVETGEVKAPDGKPINQKAPAEKGVETEILTPQRVAERVGAPADAKIETRDLDEFFAIATTVEEWMNDDEKATATRFAALVELLKTQLQDVQVVVWGEAEKRVAIIGKCQDGLAGLTTLIVET